MDDNRIACCQQIASSDCEQMRAIPLPTGLPVQVASDRNQRWGVHRKKIKWTRRHCLIPSARNGWAGSGDNQDLCNRNG